MDKTERDHDDVEEPDSPVEIAITGDLTDNESDLTDRLLSVPPGGECMLFFRFARWKSLLRDFHNDHHHLASASCDRNRLRRVFLGCPMALRCV